jgi:radical SAM protein with 4Fe4S-binding SPASM domain
MADNKTQKYKPSTVVWEVTFKCNMNCLHCGTDAGAEREAELSTKEALALCDELAQLGCERLILSGGEPLVRSDWADIAERLIKNGIKTGLISNGFLMTPDVAKKMNDIGLGMVGISFDGNEEAHNKIRRNPQSYQKVLQAFEFLSDAGVSVCAVSQISKHNFHTLDDIRNILLKNKVKYWQLQMTTLTGRMKDEPNNSVLDEDQFMYLAEYTAQLMSQNNPELTVYAGENIGYFNHLEGILRRGHYFQGCNAGIRVLGIESNGNIKGCLSMPEDFVEGNVRQRSLTEIWNDPKLFAYNREFSAEAAEGGCKGCKFFEICRGGCGNTAYSSTGRRHNNPYCVLAIEKKREAFYKNKN